MGKDQDLEKIQDKINGWLRSVHTGTRIEELEKQVEKRESDLKHAQWTLIALIPIIVIGVALVAGIDQYQLRKSKSELLNTIVQRHCSSVITDQDGMNRTCKPSLVLRFSKDGVLEDIDY